MLPTPQARRRDERRKSWPHRNSHTRPVSATHRNAFPEPLLSSRPLQWNGILVEFYRVRDVDFVKQAFAHIVTIFLLALLGIGLAGLWACQRRKTQ
jgi:hypothetical protein